MKMKFFFGLLILPMLMFGQLSKQQQINFEIITGFEIVSIDTRGVLERSYEYDYKFGEYTKQLSTKRDVLEVYSTAGVLEKVINNKSQSEKLYGFKINGQDSSKAYYKYKLNDKGNVAESMLYHRTVGDLEKRYEYVYNQKYQIIKCLVYNGESAKHDKTIEYFYDANGDLVKVESYYEPSIFDKHKLKLVCFKSEYIYNDNHQVISYKSYTNNFGQHGDFFDMYGDELSLEAKKKKIELKWRPYIFYKYEYSDNVAGWVKRIEYEEDLYSANPIKYISVAERTYLTEEELNSLLK